jgi:hypothetical protein
MRLLAEPEFWLETSQLRPQASAHPLAVFDPGECGAWVDTLRALRALPNSTARPRPPRGRDTDAD